MEYICSTLDQKLKEFCLHVVKSDKLVFHFQMKKLKSSRGSLQSFNFWNYFEKCLKLDSSSINKLKKLFYGNNIYIFLNPFDSHVVLPIFNPISIIKTDKTYNFITINISCDFQYKLSDIELNFVCGRVTDNEDCMIEEIKNRILIDKDLGLNLDQLISSQEILYHTIHNLAKELIIYYKNNDQLKCLYTLMSRICRTKYISKDSKRLILNDLNFDFNPESRDGNFSPNNEFKILNVFQSIFQSTRLEIRNECKTWIFNITNDDTISTLNCLKEALNLKYFKNFLIDIDVSLIIDLENKYIVITHERSTKYKTFIELARQIAKLFEIIKYLDIQSNHKMLKYLRHYKNGKNKSMLIFQIPLTKGVHLNSNIDAVSFVIGYSIGYETYSRAAENTKYVKNGQKNMQKVESQTSSSLNVQVYPNFSQSFLLCSLKRDISNVGSILESLENSADTLVEFNEYITMGRILYPSIMDGEEKYNVTFVSRSKDEIAVFYRDYFALDIVFPNDTKTNVFSFHVYDKASSSFYADKEDIQTNIIPIPLFKYLKQKIEEFLYWKGFKNDNNYIDFKTNNFQTFHIALKLIFDYLGCLYIIRKLQSESFRLQSLDDQRYSNPERFYLEIGNYIESICIDINLDYFDNGDKVLVKMSNASKNEFSVASELKETFAKTKVSHLVFRLELQKDDYSEVDDKNEMKKIYEEFFKIKVRHKFYCWKYFRGFINIFCTPIYRSLKPYELLNVELKQYTHNTVNLVRRNDSLQQVLNDRKLYIEILLQTLEVKKFDIHNSDISFIIRYNDNTTKEHADVTIVTDNKFNEIKVGGKVTNDPVYDIFKFMTMSIKQIKEAIS